MVLPVVRGARGQGGWLSGVRLIHPLLVLGIFSLAALTLWESHQHHLYVEQARARAWQRRGRLRVEDLVSDSSYIEHVRAPNSLFTDDDNPSTVAAGSKDKDGAAKEAMDLGLLDPACHTIPHLELDGTSVVKWGADNLKETAGDCCDACQLDPDCNVWVWCESKQGCGTGNQYKECWLKRSNLKTILTAQALSNPNVGWMSGAIYDDSEKDKLEEAEANRLHTLKNDPELPLVYLSVSIKGKYVGRMLIVLYKRESPVAAENFRQLCTGEKGVVPEGKEGGGRPYHFKGAAFYRIIDNFIIQTGANTESVYGGQFKDDPAGLALKHDRPGLLSMANVGPNTSTSHFSILMAPAPHLDGHYVIFGEVVEGMDVVRKINALAKGKPNGAAGPEEQAIISDSGQLRRGSRS